MVSVPEPECRPECDPELRPERPRLWILREGRRGDDNQLLTLAAALGCEQTVLDIREPLWRAILDHVCLPLGLPLIRRPLPNKDFPDLLLASGGRGVGLGLKLRAASQGRTRLVFVGRPWTRLDVFDLVITTPQYRLPERTNVMQNLLPLNRGRVDGLADRPSIADWDAKLSSLPRPWTAVILGGASGSFRFPPEAAQRFADIANRLATEHGGTLLVTTSPRTPMAAADALFGALSSDIPSYRHTFKADQRDNPYPAFLALADRFLITGESASMLAEAVGTDRPVDVFDLPERLLSRILTSSLISGGRNLGPLMRGPVERGLWTPARDLRYMRQKLAEAGLLGDPAETKIPASEVCARELESAVERIRALLSAPGTSPDP